MQERDPDQGFLCFLGGVLIASAIVALVSCTTIEVISNAPEAFWGTAWDILVALWEDITSLLL